MNQIGESLEALPGYIQAKNDENAFVINQNVDRLSRRITAVEVKNDAEASVRERDGDGLWRLFTGGHTWLRLAIREQF